MVTFALLEFWFSKSSTLGTRNRLSLALHPVTSYKGLRLSGFCPAFPGCLGLGGSGAALSVAEKVGKGCKEKEPRRRIKVEKV
jgi:hypothetical protein